MSYLEICDARLEIEWYLSFLPDVESYCVQKRAKAASSFSKMAKASCLLILYSYIESTVAEAITSIQDEIAKCSAEYPHLSDKAQKAWLDDLFLGMHLDDVSHKTYKNKIADVATSIAGRQAIRFSSSSPSAVGNINFDRLKKICNQWGIPLDMREFEDAKSTIDWIAEERNNLAHGNKTFEECGRDITLEQLNKACEVVVGIMGAFSESAEKYREERKYLCKQRRIMNHEGKSSEYDGK